MPRRISTLYTYPWPHLVIDNFLSIAILRKVLQEIDNDSYEFEIEMRGSGRIEYSALKSRSLWRALFSADLIRLLSHAFGAEVKLNQHNMLQLRRMNDATPEFPLHNDSSLASDQVVSFLYLSPGWAVTRGGRLRLFRSAQESIPAKLVDPVWNRFIAFKTSADHWHSVERVYEWERRSVLALWDIRSEGIEEIAPPSVV